MQSSGKGMKRHEKPLGRHRLHLEKQGFGPHRDSRYVRHVVLMKESRVDGAGHDPTIQEGGYGGTAHCTQISCGNLGR